MNFMFDDGSKFDLLVWPKSKFDLLPDLKFVFPKQSKFDLLETRKPKFDLLVWAQIKV